MERGRAGPAELQRGSLRGVARVLRVPEGLIGGESERRYERNGRGGGVTDILVRLVRGGAAAGVVARHALAAAAIKLTANPQLLEREGGGGRARGREGGRGGGRGGRGGGEEVTRPFLLAVPVEGGDAHGGLEGVSRSFLLPVLGGSSDARGQ